MTADEIARLNRLLAARDGKRGYVQNVVAIRARMAELTAEQSKPNV